MISFLVAFIRDLWLKQQLIFALAVRDFRNSYIGSGLGIVWIFLEPLVYVTILWFVFSQGLKIKPDGGAPYVAWLMSTMVAWNYFSNVLGASPNLLKPYRFLLNREFNFSTLPVVKILSGFFLHIIFFVILVGVLALNEVPVTVYWLQSLYYSFCLATLLLALSWTFSALGLFARDFTNIVSIGLQVGFWVSPIFWDLRLIPQQYHSFLKLNPLYYPLEGYRASFLYGQPFWANPYEMLYFWGVTVFLLLFGAYIFRALRPSFGDVI